MSTYQSEHPIILYQYRFSPYAKRVAWYLQLRGIPYKKTEQPALLPRPDIAALGINYRRIPILSIGRDVYLDTRLILRKLETIPGPRPSLGAPAGEHHALTCLLERFVVEAGPFAWAATLIPQDMPIFKDKAWLRDREDFFQGGGSGPAHPLARAEALSNLREMFELLERSFFGDGRDWILQTDRPSLADIEAIWPLHWLKGMPGALPEDLISDRQYPRVFAWIERFQSAVSAAAFEVGKAPTIGGAEAAQIIVTSPYFEKHERVEHSEPIVGALGLKPGDAVTVFPTDTGRRHKDQGILVGLNEQEVVFETRADLDGSPIIKVHAPRHGFRITRGDKKSSSL
ncbi:hypothetical protein BD289DRAFT_367251 [Coniella lustricola]|uniref:Uncharacterized protein n=1 Tax=Coniella lustricola TaxID=2025994 RepID=A0A2T3A9Q7_9PEZI|nr:hypothetical protein BD289DRAFT_367251 [Coniella lustricola]